MASHSIPITPKESGGMWLFSCLLLIGVVLSAEFGGLVLEKNNFYYLADPLKTGTICSLLCTFTPFFIAIFARSTG